MISAFKVIPQVIFALAALWVTRHAFRSYPLWRRLLSALIALEVICMLLWITMGADDSFYLFFNNYWVGLVTFVAIYAVIYLLAFILKRERRRQSAPAVYVIALLVTVGLGIIGHHNTVQPRLTRYDVDLGVDNRAKDSINLLLVTDLHIGPIIGEKEIDHLQMMVKDEKIDYLLFGGDMIDLSLSYATTPGIEEALQRLIGSSVPPGHTFFVMGNHEYYADTEEKEKWANELGILLCDDVVRLPEGIYLIGRDSRIGNPQRASMESLTSVVPPDSPAIILSHEPEEYGEEEVTDRRLLVLHGHTHNGQHFLFHPFLYLKTPYAYGMHQRGETVHIISSGYGVSTSTLRIGTHSEAVVVKIKF